MTTAANNNTSAFRALYAMMTTALTRTGVSVGSTADYPRIEIHTITEGERLDKSGALRRVGCTVESMTTDSMLACHNLNAKNLDLIDDLTGQQYKGYTVTGVLPTQLQELTETSDSKNLIYRLLQGFEVYILHTGPEEDPEPDENTDAEANSGPVGSDEE